MKTKLTFFLFIIGFIVNGQSPQEQELGKLYMSGKLDQVIDKTNEYLNSEPENLSYNLILGRALADNGSYKEAIPYLQFAVDNDKQNSWRKAWGLGYLGTCYYMLSDLEKSESAFQACIDLNATKNATAYAASRIATFGNDEFYQIILIKNDIRSYVFDCVCYFIISILFCFCFCKLDSRERKNHCSNQGCKQYCFCVFCSHCQI